MNRRALLRLIITGGITWMMALTASLSRGALPNSIITGDATSDAAVKAIGTFLASQVQQLANDSQPQAQQAARDAIASQVVSSDASSTFLDAYSRLLNEDLLPLTKNEHLRVRLNAAIAAARVADRAQNAHLAPVALAFIHDSSEAVIFWGLRAADSIVPTLLHNPLIAHDNPLIQSIVPAAKAHPDGPVVQAAYDTLSLGIINNRPWVQTVTPDMLNVTIPMMLDLLEFRVDRYVHKLPQDPQSENRATLFLADNRTWAAETDAQHVQSAKLIVKLLSLLCDYTANADVSRRDSLIPVVQQTASALWVVGDFNQSATLKSALDPLIKLGINTKPQDLLDMSSAVYQAAKSLPGLSDLPAQPTTQPAQ